MSVLGALRKAEQASKIIAFTSLTNVLTAASSLKAR
jgi:hypothetical protein